MRSRPVRAAAPTRTILVVDDEPSIVRALEFGLRRRGFLVLSANNGHDALAILESTQSVDLLLSDVVMPGGVSGLELARLGLELRPDLPVLLITGYAYDLLKTLGARDEEFQMVTKPFSVAALVSRIDEMLAAPIRQARCPGGAAAPC